METIRTRSDMSPLFTYKGLITGKTRSKIHPVSMLREKLNSRRKRLNDKKKMYSLPAESLHQLRMDNAEKEYIIAKCKAMVTGLY